MAPHTHPHAQQDGQLSVFMSTARRQIADLEANVKELQKM
jgi:hypothetical protein